MNKSADKNKKTIEAKKPAADTANKKTTPKLDTATVKIYDDANELIRTLKVKVDSGFNRQYWSFEKKGERQPGSSKPKPGDIEPGGEAIFPGTYKLVVELGKDKDSAMLLVKPDPQAIPNKVMYDAKEAMLKRISKSNDKLVALTDQLSDAEESITKVESSLKNIETKEADSLRKLNKAMTDSIKNIKQFIFGKPLEKQGYGRPYQETVIMRLQDARSAVTSKDKIPGETELASVVLLETLVQEVVHKANSFFSTNWKSYEEQVNSNPVSLFKEFKEL